MIVIKRQISFRDRIIRYSVHHPSFQIPLGAAPDIAKGITRLSQKN